MLAFCGMEGYGGENHIHIKQSHVELFEMIKDIMIIKQLKLENKIRY